MAPEDPEDVQEAATEDATEHEPPDTETAPVLNRAQRRAQARGKSASSSASHNAHSQMSGSHGSRTGGHAGPVRFPRTGHK